MSAGPGSPITTYFRVCDGVRVRFADTNADSDTTVLLLAPSPGTGLMQGLIFARARN